MTYRTSHPPYMIGYSDMRCDDPRGQFYNWNTMRAMIVNGDGTGRRELAASTLTTPWSWTQLAGWSSDGAQAIVHASMETPENYAWERANKTFRMTEGWLLDSCLVDLASGEVENLTAVERVSIYNTGLFFWPGNPNRLGFQAMIGSVSHPYSMDRDGRNKRDLSTGDDGFTYGYSASPDGKRITYHKNYQVFIADADGGNALRIDNGHPFHFCPYWSPDGKWIAFLSGTHYDNHPHLVAADGSGLRKLGDRGGYAGVIEMLDHPDFHSASSSAHTWSPDSRWVYYPANITGATELVRVSIDGKIEQVTHEKPGTHAHHVSVSPDGHWIVYGSTRDGARSLYVARADGSDPRPITEPVPGRATCHARWRPVAGAARPT
ncbi:MAG: hypothetical protein K8S99_10335 [Planctomycetes bacterium]|nr:hypothetical protein [Planctomycetota bacterium]